MSLLDLRVYFMRNAKPCRDEQRAPGMHPAQLGWLCTLPAGHDGKHIAHDIDGTLIATWSAP